MPRCVILSACPVSPALAAALRERGVMVRDDILTVDEMEAALQEIRAAQ